MTTPAPTYEELRAENAKVRAQLDDRIAEARRYAAKASAEEPTDPSRYDGSAEGMRRNAAAWVAAGLAEWFEAELDEGTDPIEAAREVVAEVERQFRQTAKYAPQSSDWLALPRWAAHVQALAEAVDGGGSGWFMASVRAVVRWADKHGIDEVA